jgi:hypothetical protein
MHPSIGHGSCRTLTVGSSRELLERSPQLGEASRSRRASTRSAAGWKRRALTGARSASEVHAGGAAVVGFGAALDEPVALAEPHHRGHRLLGEAGAAGDLAHPQPVLLELESRLRFCHADPVACQNSREFPQIATMFRHAGLPATRQTSL